MVETRGGTYCCLQGDVIVDQLRQYGAHQRNDVAMAKSLLRAGDSVIDVGAHIGTTAVPFARVVGANGHVFAFEAARATFDLCW